MVGRIELEAKCLSEYRIGQAQSIPMPVEEKNRLESEFFSLEGGIDSGIAPSLIQPNQVAKAINTQFRNGYMSCRPAFNRRRLVFPDNSTKAAFEDGLFQGCSAFSKGSLRFVVASISGRLYRVSLLDYTVTAIPLPDSGNNSTLQKAWFCQAEDFLIVQDGKSKPYIYDGVTLRRALADEVPVGGPTTYGIGRIWVASGNQYVGGNILYGDPGLGTASILKFTENDFYNEGGAFSTPLQAGEITALSFVANQGSATGDGGLMVFTQSGVFQFDAPVDRTTWKDQRQPLQRVALLEYGSLSNFVSRVNGDMYFRAHDGIRSFYFAFRQFGDWGNTPISNEQSFSLEGDDQNLLGWCSGINFYNRMLMTGRPQLHARGIWHQVINSIDFQLISGMRSKSPPAWEGAWTGIMPLQLFSTDTYGVKRGFAMCFDADFRICLYEISKNDSFDNGNTRIDWTVYSRSVSFQGLNSLREFVSSELWYEDVQGRVSTDVKLRADESPCWLGLSNWNECVSNTVCAPSNCYEPPKMKNPMSLPRRATPTPPNDSDNDLERPMRQGYEFQTRWDFRGHTKIKKGRFVAKTVPESASGKIISPEGCT